MPEYGFCTKFALLCGCLCVVDEYNRRCVQNVIDLLSILFCNISMLEMKRDEFMAKCIKHSCYTVSFTQKQDIYLHARTLS